MSNLIQGIHHITAIAGDPQRNYDFYTKTLGLRMVKKTVNFDDPQTYHFYYGNVDGSPGTILTFFPWPRVKKGKNGTGMATQISFSVPDRSLEFWKERFESQNIPHTAITTLFDEPFISFTDPDGLELKLVAVKNDDRTAWNIPELPENAAVKGFHGVTLTLRNATATASVLSDVLGYKLTGSEGNVQRYQLETVNTASVVDILLSPDAQAGTVAGGTNHHVAFRVHNEDALMEMRQQVLDHGLHITEKIDRNYFYSLYFREPGGVLFEIATDNPGFAIDEPAETLGQALKLPEQYEPYRASLEKTLPALKM